MHKILSKYLQQDTEVFLQIVICINYVCLAYLCSVSNFVVFLAFSMSPAHALLALHLSTSFFFLSECNWYCIFNFSFHMFIASISYINTIDFLCIDFLSCKLASLTYSRRCVFFGGGGKFLRIFYLDHHVI